ncbi:MAG: threonine synthase, partial [Deltaproteobacteria bacterium]|nr:threonine synthase [Deltaproteobacteria bacterium]
MRLEDFPEDVRDRVVPAPGGRMVYECLSCGAKTPADGLHCVCPDCGGLTLLEDEDFGRLAREGGAFWRRLF